MVLKVVVGLAGIAPRSDRKQNMLDKLMLTYIVACAPVQNAH